MKQAQDATAKDRFKDPFAALDDALGGIFVSLGRGLGQTMKDITDGISNAGSAAWDAVEDFGERTKNVFKNIVRGNGLHWESDIERADRIMKENMSPDTMNAYGGDLSKVIGASTPSIFAAKMGAKLGVDYSKMSYEDAAELVAKYSQGPGGGAAQEIVKAIEYIRDQSDDIFDGHEFDSDLSDARDTYKEEVSDLKEELNNTTDISKRKELQDKIKRYNEKISTINNREAFFNETKKFFLQDKNAQSLANDSAAAMCNVLVYYLHRRVNGYENREFSDYYLGELQKGNIGVARYRVTGRDGAFWGVGSDRWRNDRSNSSVEPKMGKYSSGGGMNSSTAINLLQKNNVNYAIVFKDTNSTGRANHFSLIGKDHRNNWIDLDHTRNDLRGSFVRWNRVHNLYYYKK